MTAKVLVFINGPINSGKSTIASHLASAWPKARHVDGDEVVSRDGLSFEDWIERTIQELAERGCREVIAGAPLFVSYCAVRARSTEDELKNKIHLTA